MWQVIGHNNYARSTDPLRIVNTQLTWTRLRPVIHFSAFIYFFGIAGSAPLAALIHTRLLPLAVLILDRPVKLPIRLVIARQLLLGEQRANHLDRNAVLFEDRVVEGAISHLAGTHKIFMERVDLQTAEQVCRLVERPVTSRERAPHFSRGVVHLVPDAIDQQIDTLLRRHLLQVKTEREDDASAAVAAPEEESDAVFGRFRELHIPEQQFPIERPAFGPERRAEQSAIGLVA